ncbi:MAG: FoF1 ATP synthase subunit a, partial [Oscillospiraceae bacterium]|nr:FoF1 ATP synthase subunit a [Oscillospiraceae bacterium]
TQTAVSSFLVMLLLCVAGYFLGQGLKKRPGARQVLTEKLVGMLYNMVEETMGRHNLYWAPYIGALFLSSLGGTLIGMTGFLRSATADLSTTITWALMTSVLVWACNIKNNGFFGWLKGFAEPVSVMLPMNIISEIAQPISMAFRHFGNIAGGGVLTSLIYSALAGASSLLIGLISGSHLAVALALLAMGAALIYFGLRRKKLILKIFGALSSALAVCSLMEIAGLLSGLPVLQVGIPAVLSLYFDVFAGGVQALVFSLLTMVYIGNACPPPEANEEEARLSASKN